MNHKKITVYVVHGYTASSNGEWFPWLKTKLSALAVDCTVFDMPNPDAPAVSEWDQYLDENILICDENTYFIGHSLGCIAILRHLEKRSRIPMIGGILLVSGFIEPVSTLSMLDPFIKPNLNTEKLIPLIKRRCVISSPSDSIVAYPYSCHLAEKIAAYLITIEDSGHFIAQEGFTEFPQLYNEFCNMINQP